MVGASKSKNIFIVRQRFPADLVKYLKLHKYKIISIEILPTPDTPNTKPTPPPDVAVACKDQTD